MTEHFKNILSGREIFLKGCRNRNRFWFTTVAGDRILITRKSFNSDAYFRPGKLKDNSENVLFLNFRVIETGSTSSKHVLFFNVVAYENFCHKQNVLYSKYPPLYMSLGVCSQKSRRQLGWNIFINVSRREKMCRFEPPWRRCWNDLW